MSLPLMPAPYQVTTESGALSLPDGAVVSAAPELAGVAQRFIDDVAGDGGPRLRTGDDAQITLTIDTTDLDALPATAGLRADGNSAADERHGIRIDSGGVTVWGPTPEAVYRGATTVRQLIAAGRSNDDDGGVEGAAQLPFARILDVPRFAWRGLSFDVSRTFHDAETVARVLDLLAVHKLNVLHLHLTDNEGWRFEVPGYEKLTTIGAQGARGDRPGGHYTPEELTRLHEAARARFITLVPEVDIPGHTAAVFAAYPELKGEVTALQEKAAEIGFHADNLDPHDERTWELVTAALRAAADSFPDTAFLHIGADEAWGMDGEDFVAFVQRAVAIVRDLGRDVIGWQEVARGEVGGSDVVQYWIEAEEIQRMFSGPRPDSKLPDEIIAVLAESFSHSLSDVATAVDKGAKILASPFTVAYLDRPYADPPAPGAPPMPDGVGAAPYRPVSLETVATWEPIEVTPAASDDAAFAGVEAALWCETVESERHLQVLVLPRLAQLAETGWSPRGSVHWPDQAQRLGAQAGLWSRRDWTWFAADSVPWAQVP